MGTKRLKVAEADILALKSADRIAVYSLAEEQDDLSKFTTHVACVKMQNENTYTWEFDTYGSILFLDAKLAEATDCETHFLNPNINLIFQTFAGSLKVGDEVEFVWLPDVISTKESLKAKLHGDLIKAVVYRDNVLQFHYVLLATVQSADKRWFDNVQNPVEFLE